MLFERFRRPRWQHDDAGVRRQAIARMPVDDPDDQRRLRGLALRDRDSSVRAAAAKRLDDLPLLRSLLGETVPAAVREAAGVRYRQLLAGGVGEDGGLDARLSELAAVEDPALLAHAVRNGREEAFRAAVLERLDDSAVIAEVALHDSVFRMRQAAVERLDDPERLDWIASQAHGDDRRLARAARQRAARLREAASAHERLVAEAEALCDEARRLVDRPTLTGNEAAEAQRLCNRWSALGALPKEAPRDRFAVLLNRLQSRLMMEWRRQRPETADAAAASPEGERS